MIHTADTRKDGTNAGNAHSKGSSIEPQASFSPPPTTLRLACATPDFQPDFRILCRGDEYGTETSLAFRQITQSGATYERYSGVAVELESLASNANRRSVIERAVSDLTIPGAVVSKTLPAFVSVPTPEKTILFISPRDPSVTALIITNEIRHRFAELNSGITHPAADSGKPHADSQVLPMIRPERPVLASAQSHVQLGTIYAEAGAMVDRLKASNAFPKWREFHWTLLQSLATEAMRPMMKGTNPADCVPPFGAKLKELSGNPGINRSQRESIGIEFIRTASDLYRGSARKAVESATA